MHYGIFLPNSELNSTLVIKLALTNFIFEFYFAVMLATAHLYLSNS